jgi:biopolymer transport protein ExbD
VLTRPRFAGISGFGFLYSVILLLIAVPMAMIFTLMWDIWPWSHSTGLDVRITIPFAQPRAERLIVRVQRAEGGKSVDRAELRVNSKSISWGDLRDALREDLSWRPNPVVYIEARNDLQFDDVVRVIDIVREDWPSVPVVLLTPSLQQKLDGEREEAKPEESIKLRRALPERTGSEQRRSGSVR